MQPYTERINQFRKKMQENQVDATILMDRENIYYFTGFRMNTAADSILYISSSQEVVYIVPKLDYERAVRDCWLKSILPFPEDNPNYLEPLNQILKKKIDGLGVELQKISLHQYKFLREKVNSQLIDIDNYLAEIRSIKSTEEINIMRKAAYIADIAMNEAIKISNKKGIREFDISMQAKYIMEKEGAEGLSFEPFVMSGEDAALPRRFSTQKELMPNELVVFDMGAKYKGYCSDITRTFSTGSLSDKEKDIFKVAYEAQKYTIESIKPGMLSGDVDKVARDFINDYGYGDNFPHLTGHGIGLSEHETPIIDIGTEIELKPNMVVTIEPGIYVKGIGATRIEDMVLITDKGCELLTNTKRWLI